jgi:uncharacterized membrane protein
MVEKEIMILCLLVVGIFGLLYGFINQMKLKRLHKIDQKAGEPLGNSNVARLVLRRRVLVGYGVFIVSGLVLGFI